MDGSGEGEAMFDDEKLAQIEKEKDRWEKGSCRNPSRERGNGKKSLKPGHEP